jgi:hypothetical protein
LQQEVCQKLYSTVEASHLKEDVKVFDKCPDEELHAMMGFVNHTFWDGYAKVVGCRKQAVKFS